MNIVARSVDLMSVLATLQLPWKPLIFVGIKLKDQIK